MQGLDFGRFGIGSKLILQCIAGLRRSSEDLFPP